MVNQQKLTTMITKFNLTQNKQFIASRKLAASNAISKFKFSGEMLDKLQAISKRGYVVSNNAIQTIIGGETKRSIFICNL